MQKQLNEKLKTLCDNDIMQTDNYVANYYITDITSDYNNVLLTYGNYSKSVRYTYGLDVLGTVTFGCGMIEWTEDGESTFDYSKSNNAYYFLDEQGTPVKLTNQAGKVVEKYSYDEYGVPSLCTTISNYLGKNNIIGYAGYQYDNETGLYYVQARYYNPDTAGFISKDIYRGVITNVQSLNRYVYCCSNPITYVDPSGYYTNVEGIIAHQQLQLFFMLYYSSIPSAWKPGIEIDVYGVTTNKTNWGRMDMILENKKIVQVYEIKPIRDRYVGEGEKQLQGYIDAINNNKNENGNKKAVKGTSFSSIANNLHLVFPADETRMIKYYTFPEEPGMIYYSITKSRKELEKDLPVIVSNMDEQDVCEAVVEAGGTIAAGYVVYRVIRLLMSMSPVTWWTMPGNLVTP